MDSVVVNAVPKALETQGATVKLLAPKRGTVTSNEGEVLHIDHNLPTVSSVLFDAVFVSRDESSANDLCNDANAILFVKEACKHAKAIAASDGGVLLLHKADLPKAETILEAESPQFKGPSIIVELGETVDQLLIYIRLI